MLRALLVLMTLTLFFTAPRAHAQESAQGLSQPPSAEARVNRLEVPRELELEEPPPVQLAPTSPRSRPGLRVLAELGFGVVGAALSFSISRFMGNALCDDDCSVVGELGSEIVSTLSYFIVSLPLVVAGVTLGGRLGRGKGSAGAAFIGTLIGTLAGAGLSIVAALGDSQAFRRALFFVVPFLQIGGGVVGYEISHASN